MGPENLFMRCIDLLAFMEIAFSHYRFHHIHGIQDKHLRGDAEGHCRVLKGVAHWDDGVAVTGEVGSTRGMSLLKILWLVLMIYVRTMASAHIITVVRSLGVSRNILGAGGHIL